MRMLESGGHDSKPISSCDFQPVPIEKARPTSSTSTTDEREKWAAQAYRLATVGEDNHYPCVAAFLCALTRRPLLELAEHTHFVHGVAWHPLNEYIATQSSDRAMHVYRISDTARGRVRARDARLVGTPSAFRVVPSGLGRSDAIAFAAHPARVPCTSCVLVTFVPRATPCLPPRLRWRRPRAAVGLGLGLGRGSSDLSPANLQIEKEWWKPWTTFRCTTMQAYDLAWSPTGDFWSRGARIMWRGCLRAWMVSVGTFLSCFMSHWCVGALRRLVLSCCISPLSPLPPHPDAVRATSVSVDLDVLQFFSWSAGAMLFFNGGSQGCLALSG
ncbi:hypothetical protein C8F04DRAFT_1274099 [Mycena alexandri]|uniref:Uncharacterized protein n=1 Tax=Mycena alexandri TaxID=1745969 RepID=A0AAD6WQ79_9AGAR|nr:hypothetical protein C8F04DRAFT_1274099 [Mycena alexandri]